MKSNNSSMSGNVTTMIISKIDEVKEDLVKEIFDFKTVNQDEHNRIEKQTTATNGKVAALDKQMIQIQTSVKIIGGFLSAIVVPVVVWFVITQLERWIR